MITAYVYKADLYCKRCADKIMETPGMAPNEDSDRYPQGPYGDGGGEADHPQHCGGCRMFLENPITDDGRNYLRTILEPYIAPDDGDERDWEGIIADRAEDDGRGFLAAWARHYGAQLGDAPPRFENCGCCGHLHRPGYTGDCRNDSERFTHAALDEKYGPNGWTELGDSD